MRTNIYRQACLVLVLLGAIGGALLTADTKPDLAAGDKIKPNWKQGDQWVVETATQMVQYRGEFNEKPPVQKLQWQFTVGKPDKIGGQDCHQVQVDCLVPGKQGVRKQEVAKIWTDQKTMALRQIQTKIPVQGKYRTMTESYQFKQGKSAPVLGPLTAIPLDMPLFLPGGVKKALDGGGPEKFHYEANDSPLGTKAIGDVGFAYEVEQNMKVARPAEVKGLLPDEFTKDLDRKQTVEVKLTTPDRTVTQLWQPNMPWPVYSKNGVTECRLIKVMPAQAAEDK